jgi:hypothetical protein
LASFFGGHPVHRVAAQGLLADQIGQFAVVGLAVGPHLLGFGCNVGCDCGQIGGLGLVQVKPGCRPVDGRFHVEFVETASMGTMLAGNEAHRDNGQQKGQDQHIAFFTTASFLLGVGGGGLGCAAVLPNPTAVCEEMLFQQVSNCNRV